MGAMLQSLLASLSLRCILASPMACAIIATHAGITTITETDTEAIASLMVAAICTAALRAPATKASHAAHDARITLLELLTTRLHQCCDSQCEMLGIAAFRT